MQDARTKWFDEGVKHAIGDGIRQIVVVAAGYDTRSYRQELHPADVKVRAWPPSILTLAAGPISPDS